MNNSNQSILSLQHSKHQCEINSYKDGKTLKSLWLSIPAYCHLKCPYCFASANDPGKKVESISFKQYEKIIKEFAELGGEFIGIPGDGEPFHNSNWELTKLIIELCNKLKIKLALFTTGDLIFFNQDGNEEKIDYSKAEYIKDKDVVLLIKYNHSNEKIQNKLVGREKYNYTRLREKAINLLINKYRLNDDRKMLGFVTSILVENTVPDKNGIMEIEKIYARTKQDNLIFDCDTVLELGRGMTFTMAENNVPYKIDLAGVFKKLTKAGAVGLNQGGTYVGNTCCDRILHHLYIKANGDVFPCIGCSRDDYAEEDNINKLLLGNIHDKSLDDLWNRNKLRRRLAEDRYNIISGVCYSCENFQTEACYSCLGRCIDSESKFQFDDEGIINTINTEGCIHHKPSTVIWLAETIDYIRKALSYPETTKMLKEKGLEYLWRPNKNLAYSLWQHKRIERIQEINAITNYINNPHDEDSYTPHEKIKDSDVQKFSQKKHYQFSELRFPMNTVWDFIKGPDELLKNADIEISDKQEEKFVNIISQSFLSNIFLASFKILYDKHDPDQGNIKYTNFILYDNIKEKYFYRSMLNDQNFTNERFDDIKRRNYSLIISRWYENIKFQGQEKNQWTEYCYNLSADFRHEIYGDYELQLAKDNTDRNDLKDRTIDISRILDLKKLGVEQKAISFAKYVDSNKNNIDLNRLNSKILTECEQGGQEVEAFVDFYSNLNQTVFFPIDDNQNRAIINRVEQEIKVLSEAKELNSHISEKLKDEFLEAKNHMRASKVLNYFVYLGIMRELLEVNYYYLLHSTNFTSVNPKAHEFLADSSLRGIIKASGLLICTKQPINKIFRSELKLFLSSIFAPFDEFYYNLNVQNIKLYDEVQYYQHSLDNIYSSLINCFRFLENSINNNSPNTMIKTDFISLLNTFKIYDISRRGISRKISGINDYPELTDLLSLVKLILNYLETPTDLKFEKNISFKNKKPLERLMVFTVIFNLISNASKNCNNDEILIKLDRHKQLSIYNSTQMKNEFLRFLNGQVNIYPTGEKHRGLAIVRSMVKKLNWEIEAVSDLSGTTVLLKFKNSEYE